jgi:predicted MFS family arabinose efflux permease
MVVLAVFAKMGGGKDALRAVILIYSSVSLLLGVLTWVMFKDTAREESSSALKGLVEALKHPATWLISAIILCAYSSASASAYITPYTTAVYGGTVTFGALLALIRQWVRPVAATGAGLLGDKIGNGRLISGMFVLLFLTMGVFVFIPGSPSLVWMLITNAIIMAISIYALRGLYWALMEEGDIPVYLTGTVIGIGSTIGYTPDVFMSLIGGHLLDKYPGELGYRYLYATLMGFAIVGLVITVYFARRYAYKRRALREAAKAKAAAIA